MVDPAEQVGSATSTHDEGPVLDRVHLLWLGAVVLLVTFVLLAPLNSFALFGSDTGEYYHLTATLTTTGHLPTSGYTGWGTAYPDFPGLFLLAGAVAGAANGGPLGALTVAVPVVAALSVVPLFLLFRRLVPQPTIALLGAAFASVLMPRAFSLAHPAPLSLGDFFVVAALWLFVEGRRDARFYLPLALGAGALIVTHHLSSYFFLVSAVGGLVVFELWRPGAWSRRFPLRELVFLAGFTVVLLVYWFVLSPQFVHILHTGLAGLGEGLVIPLSAAAVLLLAIAGAAIRWRRRRPHRSPSFRYPSTASVLRDMVLILGVEIAGITAITVIPLPGTAQTTVVAALVFFVPVFLTVVLAAGSRRLSTAFRLGPFTIAWMAVLGLAAAAALLVSNPELPADRHVEYLVIPLGLVVALGIGHLVGRWVTPHGRPAVTAAGAAVVLLLAANAAIVYPPPSDFGGFEEGLTPADAALWMWVGIGLPTWATVASDHRLSSMIYGFDGNPATWDSTPNLFTGSSWPLAAAELNGSVAPHTVRPINAIAVDQTMRAGVALDPSGLAIPMSPAAVTWFGEPPFVPLYENGPERVYWVAGPVPSVP